MHRTPTSRERFLASGLPSRLLILATMLAGALIGLAALVFAGLTLPLLAQPWTLVCVVALIAASSILGFYVGLVLKVVFIFPLHALQGESNGGPFAIGDTVQVIAGEHAGKVTRVYEKGRYGANRIDIGNGPRDDYNDFFADHQLFRVSGDTANR